MIQSGDSQPGVIPPPNTSGHLAASGDIWAGRGGDTGICLNGSQITAPTCSLSGCRCPASGHHLEPPAWKYGPPATQL